MEVVAVADKNPAAAEAVRPLIPRGALVTADSSKVLERQPDVLVEATPTILEAAVLVSRALDKKINVVLMNGEVDQVFGRLLARKAQENGVILTSDAGDQHGVLSRLVAETRSMGLEVVMAGNNKGFLDRYANDESIVAEAAKRRLSVRQCAAYSDGSKLAIEMCILANANGFNLLKTGMTGPRVGSVYNALKAFDFDRARELGGVVDYVLAAEPGGSVFVIGYANDPETRFYMNYYKMGEGPYYLFLRPYHLCHFETPVAIRSIIYQKRPILIQKKRVLEVGCRAKIDLKPGTRLEGIGGHHVYGILEKPSALPIGMAEETTLLTSKKKDEPINWDDVRFPDNDLRLDMWREQAQLTPS
jgi:predicted homoserine dehydrogenase-like protein